MEIESQMHYFLLKMPRFFTQKVNARCYAKIANYSPTEKNKYVYYVVQY